MFHNTHEGIAMKTTKGSNLQVTIRERSVSKPGAEVWLLIVTTARGYCYSCSWTGDRPTEETVRQMWVENRKAFGPHNGYQY